MLNLLFYFFLALVVLAPLPLGSNREWSWFLLVGGLGVLAGLWGLWSVLDRRRVSLSLNPLLMLLFLAVCAWAVVQAWPGAPASLHHPLWNLSGEVIEGPEVGFVSLAPDDTWSATLRLLAYGFSFFLAFQLCRDPRRAKALFMAIVSVCVITSIYGLVVFWGQYDTILFFWPLEHRLLVRGTFVNANHFATWVGMGVLCLCALQVNATVTTRRNPAYQLPSTADEQLEELIAKTWKFLAILAVLTVAIILSRSRAGFSSTLIAGIVFWLCVRFRAEGAQQKTRRLMLVMLLVGGAGFLITNEVLLSQIDSTPSDLNYRLNSYALTADGVEDSPWFGFGYGSFERSFKLYRDESVEALLDKAHNTYLENLFELGWPAALALFACVGWLALICLRGLRQRGRDWVYPATGLAATTLVAIHALVDFSLQIPATAVTYTAIMGAACAQSRSSRGA